MAQIKYRIRIEQIKTEYDGQRDVQKSEYIYEQLVDFLNLQDIIRAVNGTPNPHFVPMVPGIPVDYTPMVAPKEESKEDVRPAEDVVEEYKPKRKIY